MSDSHNSLCSPLFLLYRRWFGDYFSGSCCNWRIRVPTLSSIESSLGAENYDRVLKEHLTHHSLGQQAKAQRLSLNQPFLLYNQNENIYLKRKDIMKIDSNDRDMFFTLEELKEPLVVHLEGGGNGLAKSNQHINAKADYSLFTYLNHAKYYLEIGDKKQFEKNINEFGVVIIWRSTVSSNRIKFK